MNWEFSSIHPFPARMAPSIVLKRLPQEGKKLTILDPMAGSGTTLVTARAKGHRAIGFDTDPLAVLISNVWCLDIDEQIITKKAVQVLKSAKIIFEQISEENAYPSKSDDETRRFINYWFDIRNRKQLFSLSTAISRIRDFKQRLFLWCAFSRMIITKTKGVSLGIDISHSRPHRVHDISPVEPFARFCYEVQLIAKRSPFRNNRENMPLAQISQGDSRLLPLPDKSVDMVVTSPPYLNAIDYLRAHKLTLVWMGFTVDQIRMKRAENIGSEVSGNLRKTRDELEAISRMGSIECLPQREQGRLTRYLCDMDQAISEIVRVVRKDGKVVIVIGDSTILDIYISNSEAITYLANKRGLTLVKREERELPQNKRYLPPPEIVKSGEKMQKRLRIEVILNFKKV